MTESELEKLISTTALLMERHQRLCTELGAQQLQLSVALEAVVQSLPAQFQASTDATVAGLGRDSVALIERALQAQLGAYKQQLAASAHTVGQRSEALAIELRLLQRTTRGMLWQSLMMAMAAVAILLGGAVWLDGRYRDEIERNRVEAGLLRAYGTADVVLCGKQQLCANVDTRRGIGENGRYHPVRPRP